MPRRTWDSARAKVDSEGECRVCGSQEQLEAAHILGRSHDAYTLGRLKRSKTWHVEPLRIVPLCGTFSNNECHRLVDEHKLDLLPYLELEEEVTAVRDAGGIELARRKLAPSAYGGLA